jgi:hypothetical protein
MAPNMNDFDDLQREISFSFSAVNHYITKQAVERALQFSISLQTSCVVCLSLAANWDNAGRSTVNVVGMAGHSISR